jgi:hypothetical protein
MVVSQKSKTKKTCQVFGNLAGLALFPQIMAGG